MPQVNRFNGNSQTISVLSGYSVANYSHTQDISRVNDKFVNIGISVGLVSLLIVPVVLPNHYQSITSSVNAISHIIHINLNDESFKTPLISKTPAIQNNTGVVQISAKISGTEQYDVWS